MYEKEGTAKSAVPFAVDTERDENAGSRGGNPFHKPRRSTDRSLSPPNYPIVTKM